MPSGSRPRIVIADDHPQILKKAEGVLAPHFDVVAAVGSGEDAIAATARLDPDLVLLDVAMKGLDGFQTAAAITASGSSSRIAFMPAHAGDDYVLERIGAAYAATRPLSALCGYSTGALRNCPGIAAELCAQHEAIVPPEAYS